MRGQRPARPNKLALLSALQSQVEHDLEGLERSQTDSKEAATHEENRAEHAKDTRATEQSYLARGLAKRVEDLRRCAAVLSSLDIQDFKEGQNIAITALISVEDEESGEVQTWWLVPVAGGLELQEATWEQPIRTLTPTSPFGQALLGLGKGDTGEVRTPKGRRAFEVLEVF